MVQVNILIYDDTKGKEEFYTLTAKDFYDFVEVYLAKARELRKFERGEEDKEVEKLKKIRVMVIEDTLTASESVPENQGGLLQKVLRRYS